MVSEVHPNQRQQPTCFNQDNSVDKKTSPLVHFTLEPYTKTVSDTILKAAWCVAHFSPDMVRSLKFIDIFKILIPESFVAVTTGGH